MMVMMTTATTTHNNAVWICQCLSGF